MGRTRLTNWHAKRSGAAITVFGTNSSGDAVTVTRVIEIHGPAIATAPTVAVTEDGVEYELV